MTRSAIWAGAAGLSFGLALATSPGVRAAPLPAPDQLAASLGASADYARYRGRRYRRNAAGAAVAAGVAGALIGGAIAAQHRRRYYDDGYYYGGRPYGYYGGPGYYYGY